MGREIERKFRVTGDGWRDGARAMDIAQGYLCTEKGRTVRVRISGDKAWICVKGAPVGISRDEFEYPIPRDDAEAMLAMCAGIVIRKTRHLVEHAGHTWEVDVFHGENEGLVLAEVELEDESVDPPLPQWVGEDVSGDPRFTNSRLSREPFRGGES